MIQTYHVAAFLFDGNFEGRGLRQLDKLSSKWLKACDDMFASGGSFRQFVGPLNVNLTSTEDGALLTISVNGTVSVSGIFLPGNNVTSELELTKMFIASLNVTNVAQSRRGKEVAFSELYGIKERPLSAAVFFSCDDSLEEEFGASAELLDHLAAVYFSRYSKVN